MRFGRVILILALILLATPLFAAPKLEGFAQADSDYQSDIKSGDYAKALDTLSKTTEDKLTLPEKKLKIKLQVLLELEAKQSTENATSSLISSTEESLDPATRTKVKRYFKEAQKAYLDNKNDLARDILIQVLFIASDFSKAKKFLELGLDLAPGSYKVEDISKKYYNRSNTSFYGGNYLMASQDLEVLTVLEKDNIKVFERLGSAYYMMNEKKKAIDAWTQALFLKPDDKKLQDYVAKTKESLEKEASVDFRSEASTVQKIEIKDPQVMGVFKSQSQAAEMADNLKKQGLKQIAIDETDEGKWAVKVSRAEMAEKSKK